MDIEAFQNLTDMLNENDAHGILSALTDIDGFSADLKRCASELSLDLQPSNKRQRTVAAVVAPPQEKKAEAATPNEVGSATKEEEQAKKPCPPYYYYKDYSTKEDPDPSVPVTAPGRIPNFPAKMYAILSRPELADIVSWMPHGRSWKVHKPREFEIKVIPSYFEHNKFSSFIRQANGWGFRRMIQKGRTDRNSYYHELFLRGKPHLLKEMKRPSPNMKPVADAKTEPDFPTIALDKPLPEMSELTKEQQGQCPKVPLNTLSGPPPQPNPMFNPPLTSTYAAYQQQPEYVASTTAERPLHYHYAPQPPVAPPAAPPAPPAQAAYHQPEPVVAKVAPAPPPTEVHYFPESECLQGFNDAILQGISPMDDSFWLK